MKNLLICCFMLLALSVKAQVEHNFDMDPENTDCHLINIEYKTAEELIQEIRKRTFRFSQEISISRYRVPHHLEYFSCDGKSGFLLAEMQDKKYIVYTEISLGEWQKLLDAGDVLEYYNQEFTSIHKRYGGH